MTRKKNDLNLGLEVLRYAARGWTYQQIGAALYLGADTVRGRLSRLFGLLGARNATHAVVIAAAEGLLSADDLRAAVADRRTGWKAPEEEEGEA